MGFRQTRVFTAICAFLACLLLPVNGYAQSTFGDIRGTTRDPQGLALPQAVVTLHNLDDNTNRSGLSDDNGSFLFENLKPGRYNLSASKQGFAASATIAMELTARQS